MEKYYSVIVKARTHSEAMQYVANRLNAGYLGDGDITFDEAIDTGTNEWRVTFWAYMPVESTLGRWMGEHLGCGEFPLGTLLLWSENVSVKS